MTEMSALSYGGLSVLSVNTNLGACEWYGSNHPALSRVPQSSSTENQDPMRMQRSMSVAQIVQNLRSNDLVSFPFASLFSHRTRIQNLQAAALRELEEPMAKLENTWPTPDIQNVIYTLFEVLLPRPVEHENVSYHLSENVHSPTFPILSDHSVGKMDWFPINRVTQKFASVYFTGHLQNTSTAVSGNSANGKVEGR